MKNKNFLWKFLTFFGGLVIGGVGTYMLCSMILPGPVNPGPACWTKSSTDPAHKLCQYYYDKVAPTMQVDASSVPMKVKGFTIDTCLYSAMVSLMSTPTNKPAGFRVYLGTDQNTGGKYWVLVGVDGSWNDMTANILTATSSKVDLCPTLCDINSPIPGR